MNYLVTYVEKHKKINHNTIASFSFYLLFLWNVLLKHWKLKAFCSKKTPKRSKCFIEKKDPGKIRICECTHERHFLVAAFKSNFSTCCIDKSNESSVTVVFQRYHSNTRWVWETLRRQAQCTYSMCWKCIHSFCLLNKLHLLRYSCHFCCMHQTWTLNCKAPWTLSLQYFFHVFIYQVKIVIIIIALMFGSRCNLKVPIWSPLFHDNVLCTVSNHKEVVY